MAHEMVAKLTFAFEALYLHLDLSINPEYYNNFRNIVENYHKTSLSENPLLLTYTFLTDALHISLIQSNFVTRAIRFFHIGIIMVHYDFAYPIYINTTGPVSAGYKKLPVS